jgi:transposase
MNEESICWMGIDVAKKTFDAGLVRPGQRFCVTQLREVPVQNFARTVQGTGQCLDWMRRQLADFTQPPSVRAVMEATGAYSVELTKWFNEQCPALAPAIVNPERANSFIKSLGQRNSTDRIAARGLAFFGAERRPAPYVPLTPDKLELRELSRYRDALIAEKVAEGNRAEQQPNTKLLKDLITKRDRQRKKDIAAVEAAMKKLIEGSKELKRDFDLLVSIPGVAFVTASVVLAEMGDLRRFERSRQASAFAGVSPSVVTSGTSVSPRPRMCKKGNPRIRQALYLAAMTTIRYDSFLRDTYQRLIQHGKSPKAALGAIMRKLLTVMRAILISNTPFNKSGKPTQKSPEEAV